MKLLLKTFERHQTPRRLNWLRTFFVPTTRVAEYSIDLAQETVENGVRNEWHLIAVTILIGR